jgi:penicillin-binding protein activator
MIIHLEKTMKATTLILASTLTATAAILGACSDNWKVKRHDPNTEIDLDYRFNDVDARGTAQALITQVLSHPWIGNWTRDHGGKQPIVFVGTVRNDTQDYNVDPELFTNAIVAEFINSGRVRVKSARDARQELRDERLDTKYNDPATVKAVAKELNADFALTGNVKQIVQRTNDGDKLMNYYQINCEVTDVETAEIVWQGKPVEIKKTATK